nr:MAG TPA: hypothetical protein [Caudoviricetes sp.]
MKQTRKKFSRLILIKAPPFDFEILFFSGDRVGGVSHVVWSHFSKTKGGCI